MSHSPTTAHPASNGSVSAPPMGGADTEVAVAQPRRRRYTAAYKLRILREAEECAPGELGALLRREGLP